MSFGRTTEPRFVTAQSTVETPGPGAYDIPRQFDHIADTTTNTPSTSLLTSPYTPLSPLSLTLPLPPPPNILPSIISGNNETSPPMQTTPPPLDRPRRQSLPIQAHSPLPSPLTERLSERAVPKLKTPMITSRRLTLKPNKSPARPPPPHPGAAIQPTLLHHAEVLQRNAAQYRTGDVSALTIPKLHCDDVIQQITIKDAAIAKLETEINALQQTNLRLQAQIQAHNRSLVQRGLAEQAQADLLAETECRLSALKSKLSDVRRLKSVLEQSLTEANKHAADVTAKQNKVQQRCDEWQQRYHFLYDVHAQISKEHTDYHALLLKHRIINDENADTTKPLTPLTAIDELDSFIHQSESKTLIAERQQSTKASSVAATSSLTDKVNTSDNTDYRSLYEEERLARIALQQEHDAFVTEHFREELTTYKTKLIAINNIRLELLQLKQIVEKRIYESNQLILTDNINNIQSDLNNQLTQINNALADNNHSIKELNQCNEAIYYQKQMTIIHDLQHNNTQYRTELSDAKLTIALLTHEKTLMQRQLEEMKQSAATAAAADILQAAKAVVIQQASPSPVHAQPKTPSSRANKKYNKFSNVNTLLEYKEASSSSKNNENNVLLSNRIRINAILTEKNERMCVSDRTSNGTKHIRSVSESVIRRISLSRIE